MLYISDYTINLSQFSIKILDESRFKQIIVTLLKTVKCPLLVEFPKDGTYASNFEDSRDLLLILGWLIQVSCLFDKYHERFLEKITEDLEFKQDFFENEEEEKNGGEIGNDGKKLNVKIDENDIIESYYKLKKKFLRIFDLFDYYDKTKEKLQVEMSFQKLNFKLSELIMLKNEKKFEKILEKLAKITSVLENEKDNLKHEEFFWLWMESVVDLDKKEIINDPDYGFSDMKEISMNSLKTNKEEWSRGIEGLFEELKGLNENYQDNQENFKIFQVLWEKRKNQLKDKNSLEQLKNDSGKMLNEFNKKFLNFEKMQGMLAKNAPDLILPGEILSFFPTLNDGKVQKIDYDEEEKELDTTLKNLKEEESRLALTMKEKIKDIIDMMKDKFVVFPELK